MQTETMRSHGMTNHTMTHRSATEFSLGNYGRFALIVLVSFIAMYILMYAMVDSFSSVYNNVNQLYMAGLMAAPMAIIEVVLMRSMYASKKANGVIVLTSLGALIFFWSGIRTQIGIGDEQFARSMIPAHPGAILMCSGSKLSDPELKNSCSEIIAGQRREVDQLKSILARLE